MLIALAVLGLWVLTAVAGGLVAGRALRGAGCAAEEARPGMPRGPRARRRGPATGRVVCVEMGAAHH